MLRFKCSTCQKVFQPHNNVNTTFMENYGNFIPGKQRHGKYLEDASTAREGDEISRSLKMFAMLAACKAEPPVQPQNQVDAIMQDFACNGYSCDEIKHQNRNNQELSDYSDASVRGNLWKMLPPPHTAEYSKKPTAKRYNNGIKSEKYSPVKHCVFCENNNEPDAVVKSHAVRDSLGRVLCPKLRTYICPICKASGDMAHTVKYCPQKPIITMEDAKKGESYRLAKSALFKQKMKI